MVCLHQNVAAATFQDHCTNATPSGQTAATDGDKSLCCQEHASRSYCRQARQPIVDRQLHVQTIPACCAARARRNTRRGVEIYVVCAVWNNARRDVGVESVASSHFPRVARKCCRACSCCPSFRALQNSLTHVGRDEPSWIWAQTTDNHCGGSNLTKWPTLPHRIRVWWHSR